MVFVPWGIALKYKNTHKYNAFINGEYKESDINEYLNTSKELPLWLKECCFGITPGTEEINIYEKVFNLYQMIFKQTKFNYYAQEDRGNIIRNAVLSLIEF